MRARVDSRGDSVCFEWGAGSSRGFTRMWESRTLRSVQYRFLAVAALKGILTTKGIADALVEIGEFGV